MGKPTPVSKFGTQATFDPFQFSQFLQFHGLVYRWSRALTCPCRLNDQTDQWDPTCNRCAGDGWMYVNPCAAQERHLSRDYSEVKAVFSTVKDAPTVTDVVGEWDHGDATLTVQQEMRVGYRDRFVSTEQEMAWSELIFRGTGDKVPVGRHGFTRDIQRTAMRYEPIRVNYAEADDGAGKRDVYYDGVDFMVRKGFGSDVNQMEWLPGRGPAPGQLYVVHYDIHPVWVVDDSIYRIQNSRGPEAGLKGAAVLQHLPTTFKVRLDYLTPARSEP
jgi:hypothetical protein